MSDNDNQYTDASTQNNVMRELKTAERVFIGEVAKRGFQFFDADGNLITSLSVTQDELEAAWKQIADLRRHNEAMAFRLRAYALKFETMAKEADSHIDPDEFRALAADARAAADNRLGG